MATMTMFNNLGEFIQHELDTQDISIREFARKVGVSHKTITKLLNEKERAEISPSTEFIKKLAAATGVNAVTLWVLAYPEVAGDVEAITRMSATALLRNQRIEELPENWRDVIDTIIFERSKKLDNP